MDDIVELREGTFPCFYDEASGRKHKLKRKEGAFRVTRNGVGVFIGTLMANGLVNIQEGSILPEARYKVLAGQWFTFFSWDIICDLADDAENSQSIASDVKTYPGFTTAKGNRVSPYPQRPLLQRSAARRPTAVIVGDGPVRSPSGYFLTYATRQHMLTRNVDSGNSDVVGGVIQCQQCLISVEINAPHHWEHCRRASSEPAGIQRDVKESCFWNRSVASKACIDKVHLMALFLQYHHDKKYLAGLFDGFILSGHRLEGIHDGTFEEVIMHMKQL